MGGGTTGRVLRGVLTGGFSEAARNKESALLGPLGSVVKTGGETATKALTPKVPGIPSVPKKQDVAQNDEKRRQARKRKGRKSTILTGVKGVNKPLGGKLDSDGRLG